jgi:hypothetical protein
VELCEKSTIIQCDDGTMEPNHGIKVFTEYLRDAMKKMGRTSPDAEFLKNLLETACFEGVTTSQIKEPVGPWPKDPRLKRAGAMNLLNGETTFDSYGMALLLGYWECMSIKLERYVRKVFWMHGIKTIMFTIQGKSFEPHTIGL